MVHAARARNSQLWGPAGQSSRSQASSPAECSRDKPSFNFVKGHDSTMWDIVWVAPQGHRDQCLQVAISFSRHRSVPVPCVFSVRRALQLVHMNYREIMLLVTKMSLNYPKNFNETWQARILVNAFCITTTQIQRSKVKVTRATTRIEGLLEAALWTPLVEQLF